MVKKILVVDDEPDILKVVVFRLKKLGHEVLSAVNGQEALDLIQKERPSVVVLDLVVPIIDGYEVCRRLKSDDELKDISVILLTASIDSGLPEKAKELKADDYLAKPFEPEELINKVEKFLK